MQKLCTRCNIIKPPTEYWSVEFLGENKGRCKRCVGVQNQITVKIVKRVDILEKREPNARCIKCKTWAPKISFPFVRKLGKYVKICMPCLKQERQPKSIVKGMKLRRCGTCRKFNEKDKLILDPDSQVEYWYCEECAMDAGL